MPLTTAAAPIDAFTPETGGPRTALVVGLTQGGDLPASLRADDNAAVRALIEAGVFSGKTKEGYFLPTPSGPYAGIAILGLGKKPVTEHLRRAAGSVAAALKQHRIAAIAIDAESLRGASFVPVMEGIAFGQYSFDRYKEQPEDAPEPVTVSDVTILSSDAAAEASAKNAAILIESTQWARDLANRSSDDVTPEVLADEAARMAQELGCTASIFDETELDEMGMGALLAVGRGSARPPRLVILEYRPEGATKTLALVGKGLTFDTGGISLKPGEAMHEMKFDMCGAAAVLGAFQAIATIGPKINVICAVPSAENMPSSNAVTPGEIITAYNGKTIEVHNTDAEGRLILADALAYVAEQYQPDAMIDAATLTGAVIIALGHYAAGLMSTDEALTAGLQKAAKATDERVWPLPLWDDYSELMKGTHADLKNIPSGRLAGAVTAGCFLKEFAGPAPWAHLDIAGTAWGGSGISYQDTKHATGYGVRLFTQWVLDEAAN